MTAGLSAAGPAGQRAPISCNPQQMVPMLLSLYLSSETKNRLYRDSRKWCGKPDPLPISRRSNGDSRTDSSPGSSSLQLSAFPVSQWHLWQPLPHTVAGPLRLLTGFSFMLSHLSVVWNLLRFLSPVYQSLPV